MKATREQIKAARREVDMILDAARSGHHVKIDAPRVEALERLLAATAPPTDEELADLAETWRRRAATCRVERDKYPQEDEGWHRLQAKAATWDMAARELAGARREGRPTTTEGGAS